VWSGLGTGRYAPQSCARHSRLSAPGTISSRELGPRSAIVARPARG
jgi:hypothetical protein